MNTLAPARFLLRTASSIALRVTFSSGLKYAPYTRFFSAMASAFPAVPRSRGIAAITHRAAPQPTADGAVVRFANAAELKASAPTAAEGADAEKESTVVRYVAEADGVPAHRVLFASTGKSATIESLRKATIAAVTRLRALKVPSAEFVLPEAAGISPEAAAQAVTQAAALSNWAFDRYLTAAAKVPFFLGSIAVVGGGPGAAAAVATAATLAEATLFARDLSNERADEMHPARMEAVARAVAAETGAAVHVVSGVAELEAQGLCLLSAVGQSARHAPRYVELFYAGDPEHPEDVIALVGKAITFDSGGLNLKPTGGIENMHMDMSGSAAVLGAALGIHRLGIKRNVAFVIAVAENAMDALSFKPHSIIRSHKGLTVEIGNTDAEGRLVLADALSLVQERRRPHTIVDLATLTGACIIALGEYAAGLFSNSRALTAALQDAGASVGERLWPMPIFPEHTEELRGGSAHADLKSTGEGKGGSCTAAAFLEAFIGYGPAPNARDAASAAPAADSAAPTPAWAHIDLAGPAMYSKARGFMNAGGTGFAAQTLVQFVASAPRSRPAVEAK